MAVESERRGKTLAYMTISSQAHRRKSLGTKIESPTAVYQISSTCCVYAKKYEVEYAAKGSTEVIAWSEKFTCP